MKPRLKRVHLYSYWYWACRSDTGYFDDWVTGYGVTPKDAYDALEKLRKVWIGEA